MTFARRRTPLWASLILTALLALGGCAGAGASNAAVSPSPNGPSPKPTPAAPSWLLLKPGATMRLAPDRDDASHALVSASIVDLRKRYGDRVQPTDVKRAAGETVTVTRVGPALTDDPGSDSAVLVRSKDGWSGWVDGEEQLQPLVPRGSILGQSTPGTGDLVRYWKHQSDAFEDGVPLDRDVRFEFLSFVPDPGNAEYRVRIASGVHAGAIGYVMLDGLATSGGRPLRPVPATPLSQPW